MALPQAINSQTIKAEKPGWPFYSTWIVLSVLCIPLAFFLSLIVLRILSIFIGDFIVVNGVQHIAEDYLFPYVLAALAGLLTGGCQAVLLHRYLPRIGIWAWVTLGGWLLGFLLIVLPGFLNRTESLLSLYIVFPLMGLGIGVAQWLVLRRYFSKAWMWIAANLMGWGLLAWTTDGIAVNQLGLLGLGFFPSCATAAALWGLMRQTPPVAGTS